jgi:hypothetical protein
MKEFFPERVQQRLVGMSASSTPTIIEFIRKWERDVDYQTTKENPHVLSWDELFNSLLRANEEERWGIPKNLIDGFAEKIAAFSFQPRGEHIFPSLCVRLGDGHDGVLQTAELLIKRIRRIFGENHVYQGFAPNQLRLLLGHETHRATIEPIILDFKSHRDIVMDSGNTYRASVAKVRDRGGKDTLLLADQLFTFTFLYPNYVIENETGKHPNGYDYIRKLIAGGYEVDNPGQQRPERAPQIYWGSGMNKLYLTTTPCSGDSGGIVPILQK